MDTHRFRLGLVYDFAWFGNVFIGDASKVFLLSMTRDELIGTLPESVFMLFQMTFTVITPALIIGAFPERMRLGPVVIFSGLWLLLAYAPATHWVWAGGWLMDRRDGFCGRVCGACHSGHFCDYCGYCAWGA